MVRAQPSGVESGRNTSSEKLSTMANVTRKGAMPGRHAPCTRRVVRSAGLSLAWLVSSNLKAPCGADHNGYGSYILMRSTITGGMPAYPPCLLHFGNRSRDESREAFGPCAGQELDHLILGDPFPAERILRDHCLDLGDARRPGQDHSAGTRFAAPRDDEPASRVVALKVGPVPVEQPVNLLERTPMGQYQHEHRYSPSPRPGPAVSPAPFYIRTA